MTFDDNADLQALFLRLPDLDRGDLMELAAAHDAQDPAREAAWSAVREATVASHAERDLDRLRSEVAAWATRVGSVTGQQLGGGIGDEPMIEARRAAASAVLDAAAACLLGAALPAGDRAALLRPWEAVFGDGD